MPDIALSEAQQRALRSLLAADPVPGVPLPHRRVLQQLAVLIPCDAIAVHEVLRPPQGPLLEDVTDALALGVRSGSDLVARLVLVRRGRPFTGRDAAVLHLLEPVLHRLLGERRAPRLPTRLTAQERRVLRLVAAGQSNAQIAARMGIAPSTVRKHLEHAFPKLGVSNRFAAALAFEALRSRDPEPAVAAERFA